jgi:YD repeat-containing protein
VQVVESVQAEAPQVCRAQRSDGNPIYALTGAKKEFVSTGISIGGIDFVLTYDSTRKLPSNQGTVSTALVEPNAFGALWKSSLHRKLQVTPNLKKALLTRGNGTVVNFDGTGAGVFTGEAGNPNKLASITGGYLFTDIVSGDLETFDSAGKLLSITTARGQVLTYTYSGDNLTKIQSNDGRVMLFTYANQLITQVTGPDGNSIGFLYDATQNLVSMTWPDGKVRVFLYENSTFPWALTGKTDENNSRLATFAYDAQGRAVGTELAGGVNSFNVNYMSPPARVVTESFDVANNVLYRTSGWQVPTGVAVTQPNGQTVSVEAVNVLGMPSIASQSQAAGSGCSASTSAQTYDANGNIASRDDFQGERICYTYDSSNRETVRIEGLANAVACSTVTPGGATLPTGARKITTSWHPDWRLPVQVNEPTRRITTVYQGQPDPFNGNATANCTTVANLPNGKPMPVICKQVEQALLDSGSVDATVMTRVRTHTYDAGGRMLTSTDENSRTTNYSYYSDSAFSITAQDGYDADFNAVSLLLHSNGTNNATSMLDSGPGLRAITPAGNAKISTVQSKFGGASIALDGSGDLVRVANSNAFDVVAGDYTVEAFVWLASSPTSNFTIVSNVSDGTTQGWRAIIGSNRKLQPINAYWTGASLTQVMTPQQVIPLNTWTHVALTRQGTTHRTWVNGVLDSEMTGVGSINASAAPFDLGATIGSAWFFNGYIDEFRITKGKARYTANFMPPTAEFANSVPVASPADIGHTVGDLQSITNPAGHVTQYTQYDRAGRVRQMIDPKGVVTDITYTPRGWVSTVTATAPGGAGRTTSYTYDNVGQLTGVAQPDGTTLSYAYDAAHRLVGVTDAKGNSVSYTLDNAGNRIAEDIKDPTGALQRSISRSFDALNRVQQVTGAAQ